MYNGIKILLLEFEKRSQKQPKTTKKSHFWTFFNSLENPVRLKRKFLQPFYNTWGTYVCNDIKTVWFGLEKQSQN